MKLPQRKTRALPLPLASHLILITAAVISQSGLVNAAEPAPTYTRAPIAAYNFAMDDALLGNSYEKPVWNLHETLHLPSWLTVGLENRTRYESISDTFKPSQKYPAVTAGSGDQQIALQTSLWVQAKLGKFRLATEFMDSRALASDAGLNKTPNPPNNTQVDTADFTQAYLSWADQNAFFSGYGVEVKGDRHWKFQADGGVAGDPGGTRGEEGDRARQGHFDEQGELERAGSLQAYPEVQHGQAEKHERGFGGDPA